MNLRDTRIQRAGVYRCCLHSVASEFEGKDNAPDKPVEIGMKSKCVHCGQAFTLVDAKPHPLWKPDWQLETSKAVTEKRIFAERKGQPRKVDGGPAHGQTK